MITSFKNYWQSTLGLIFPNVCMHCGDALAKHEKTLCWVCENALPFTDFHAHTENALYQKLYGRVIFHHATSLLYFNKGNMVQNLMHQLKYRNEPEIGRYLGSLLGWKLLENESQWEIDAVVPVPLHPYKLQKRGYNQSECFAEGIAKVLQIPVITNNLIRNTHTESQTGKDRFERWENVKDAFSVSDASVFEGKKILIIDDVVTTGATIEACIIALQKIPNVTVSIATIAYA